MSQVFTDLKDVFAVTPETIRVTIPLGFGVEVTRFIGLLDYEAPRLDWVQERKMALVAQHRLNEILGHAQDVALTVVNDGRSLDGSFRLLIATNDASRSWFDLVAQILIPEGWGVIEKDRRGPHRDFSPDGTPTYPLG